ncbi:hypothetical protein JCM14076_13770 [Methylosoma difficile]
MQAMIDLSPTIVWRMNQGASDFFCDDVLIGDFMQQQSPASGQDGLALLHAATCLAMTDFINGHHCPTLAHRIVQQLHLLISHPELAETASSRDTYLLLLDHWQKITAQLLDQQKARVRTAKFH